MKKKKIIQGIGRVNVRMERNNNKINISISSCNRCVIDIDGTIHLCVDVCIPQSDHPLKN